ncbi:MAG: hypothetical protein DRI90_18155, partial [Deltaproteobacteria bacterium]
QDGGAGAGGGQPPCEGLGSWVPTSTGSLSERWHFVTAWTGSEMIVWGGSYHEGQSSVSLGDGARYDPQQNSWTAMTEVGAPSPRYGATGIWTGTKLVVWGGSNDDNSGLGTGATYDPSADTWTSVMLQTAPASRLGHSAVWTGSQMIVWGGTWGLEGMANGARYDPVGESWSPASSLGAPTPRFGHKAAWAGSEMIIWGGRASEDDLLDTGGIYDPVLDSWKGMSTAGAPSPRFAHSAVWSGSRLIVWGGRGGANGPYLGDGAIYDPATDTWLPVTDDGAPKARGYHTGAWTGTHMLVWGGWPPHDEMSEPATGGLYDPGTDSWQATSTCDAPHWSEWHGGVWTGSQLMAWGGRWGSVSQGGAGLGGVYTPP